MSNSRACRRRLGVSRNAIDNRRKARRAAGRWPFGGPSLSTVRRWMRQLEAQGLAERTRAEPTGKPGRPPDMWTLTETGKRRPVSKRTDAEEVNDIRLETILRRARGKALTEDEIMTRYEKAMAPVKGAAQ